MEAAAIPDANERPKPHRTTRANDAFRAGVPLKACKTAWHPRSPKRFASRKHSQYREEPRRRDSLLLTLPAKPNEAIEQRRPESIAKTALGDG
jgi:hypothetical protein